MSEKKLTIVKELIRDALDPVVLLEYYGIDIPDRHFRYNKIRCPCPIHGGDNPSGFSFDLNSKTFTCFTGHCGEHPEDWWFIPSDGSGVPRDVFLFIKLMEESRAKEQGTRAYFCSFYRAIEIASDLSGIQIDESTSAYNKEMMDKLDNQKWIRSMSKINQEVSLEVFSEDEIEIFKAQLPLCDYMGTRGFNDQILDFFEIGFSPEGIDEPYKSKQIGFCGRLVFPVRDVNGDLVGWSGRLSTDDKELCKKWNKYMHKLDFDKGFILYNYHNAIKYIKQSKEIILVEGAFDVMRLWSYGIFNVVAIMGSSLTPEQLQLAISSAFKAYVWLDPDGAGKSGGKRMAEQLRKYVDVFMVESRADPDDLTLDEAYEALSKAIRYIPEELPATRTGRKK